MSPKKLKIINLLGDWTIASDMQVIDHAGQSVTEQIVCIALPCPTDAGSSVGRCRHTGTSSLPADPAWHEPGACCLGAGQETGISPTEENVISY